MVAIDDSESMSDNHAGQLALEAMTTLCKAMTQLEVGEVAVMKFGESSKVLHPFGEFFTDTVGASSNHRQIAEGISEEMHPNPILCTRNILQLTGE